MNLIPFLALFFSILVTTFNNGFFTLPGFFILIFLYLILFLYFIWNKPLVNEKKDTTQILLLIFIFIFSLFTFYSGGIYQERLIPSILLTVIPYFLFPWVLSYGKDNKTVDSSWKSKFFILVLASLVLRILMIISSPRPVMDVYTMLKEGPLFLLSGKNPYQAHFSSVYKGVNPDYFTYGPSVLYLEVPFMTLFSDPRILLALADILAALLLYIIGKKTFSTSLLVLTFLFRPNSNFLIEQSYLEPLIFLLLIFSYFFLNKKTFLSSFLLALASSVKFHYALIFPFFLIKMHNKKLFSSYFIFSFLGLVAPFIFWDAKSFFTDTVLYFLKSPSEMVNVPVYNSLNINSLLHLFGNYEIPLFTAGIIFLIVLLFIIFHLVKYNLSKNEYHNSKLILGIILALQTCYLMFRYAFINYYYLTSSLLILWLILTINEHDRRTTA